ncbi:hypothetical protein SAMN05443661_104114 [Natronobacterium gregoryi]|nr:hypothetical protein Natgr_2212 [Natronobacterium gregoryi SP2]SFI73412.1 hypothetical protein SAMN05443661_104114 [Natronobacterium gregoryi]
MAGFHVLQGVEGGNALSDFDDDPLSKFFPGRSFDIAGGGSYCWTEVNTKSVADSRLSPAVTATTERPTVTSFCPTD